MSSTIKNWNQEILETIETIEIVINEYKVDLENIQNQIIQISNDQNGDYLKISLENHKKAILNGIGILEQKVLQLNDKLIPCG